MNALCPKVSRRPAGFARLAAAIALLALGGCHHRIVGYATHTLGGSISGLTGQGLVIANGSDTLGVNAGASSFTMPGKVETGASYALSVQTQPAGETCTFVNGSGTMPAADMLNAVLTCSTNAYTIGGGITGLTTSGLVLANGTDTVAVAASATRFTLPTAVATGSAWNVTVQTQPNGQTCAITNGSGQMGNAAITNVQVTCTDQPFTVGGSISGLTSSGLVLANGSDTLTVAANANTFTMSTAVAYGQSYAITIQSQPAGLTCSVASGAGTMGVANVTDIAVTCATNSYIISGSISGLTNGGLVLANGSDTLTVAANANTFTMSQPVAFGGAYAISVRTQPTGLTCSIANGSGTMGAANVTNVAVTCAVNSYTVGGTITGLATGGLVLANGSDTLSVAANAGTFTMNQPVAFGGTYTISVRTQPTGLTCSVFNDTGSMGATNITNVAVSCTPNNYTVGGTINGLSSGGLVLANGSDTLSLAANATSFEMVQQVAYGAPYTITVQTQPTGQTCSIANGSGTMGAAAVNNVAITCSTNSYTVGGTITGLTANGLVLANGSDTLSVNAGDTTFTMSQPVAYGASYAITVQTQPTGQTCTLNSSANGTMSAMDVTDVAVTCQ